MISPELDVPPSAAAICADGFVYQIKTPSRFYFANDCSGRLNLDPALDVLLPLLRN